MNEITRIHIAKVAYDIEVSAKKELETYIKSLETYTQDAEVLADIEIRMTELLSERTVKAGGVINSEDVAAIRKQLGEPYEFADEDGDIAVGATSSGTDANRRLYRSLDDAILGGVLSGMAAYFKVNPLWTRLIFLLITFISFGFALLVYILLWIILPAARTAAEKLKLAGKAVTLESIRELNALEEHAPSRSIAPIVRRTLGIGLGIASIIGAITTLVITIGGAISILSDNRLSEMAEDMFGRGSEYLWLVQPVFWIVVAGMLLLMALFSLVAYAFFAQKLTKRMIISGIIIIALGLLSAATVITITASQSWRVSTEAQNMTQTTKLNLPKDFSSVQSIVLEAPTKTENAQYNTAFTSVEYIVDEGAPRYELTSLPKAKVQVKIENGTTARISLDIPEDYRNIYVQPRLTIYGPAIGALETSGTRVTYQNLGTQEALKLALVKNYTEVTVNGTFQSVSVEGKGSVDLNSSSIQTLDVRAEQNLTVLAGTVRDLTVTQPEVCPGSTYSDSTRVTVSGVTSGTMTYNGKQIAAQTNRMSCAGVVVGDDDNRY
jgi:phage shock protein PspC (stress-responsive transcriptional regulator)